MGGVTGYIGLGSNLGDRRGFLLAGLAGLGRAGLDPLALSSLWETEPVDAPGSGPFLNAVVAVRARLAPLEVLDRLLTIEREAGRRRSGVANAPRTLDLDLLLWGGRAWNDARLVLPHPRMWERAFVLAPLAELAPELTNPRSGRTVAEERARLAPGPAVIRVGRLDPAGIIPRSLKDRRSATGHEVQIDRR